MWCWPAPVRWAVVWCVALRVQSDWRSASRLISWTTHNRVEVELLRWRTSDPYEAQTHADGRSGKPHTSPHMWRILWILTAEVHTPVERRLPCVISYTESSSPHTPIVWWRRRPHTTAHRHASSWVWPGAWTANGFLDCGQELPEHTTLRFIHTHWESPQTHQEFMFNHLRGQKALQSLKKTWAEVHRQSVFNPHV